MKRWILPRCPRSSLSLAVSLLRRFSALSGSEWRLLAAAVPLLAAIRVLLWVLPSRTILAAARRLVAVPERVRAGRPPIERIVWAIDAASRRIPGASCLTQAIGAQVLFRQHGYGTRLCLGVARDTEGAFRAHAWIERDGRILIGGEQSRALTRLTLPTDVRKPSTLRAP